MARMDPETAVALYQEQRESEKNALLERMRVARERMLADGARQGVPFTKTRRTAFVAAVAAGLNVHAACDVVGICTATAYRARNSDTNFARQWADALEASTAPLEERLATIAEVGAADSMATVRAAEVLLKHRDPRRYQAPKMTAELKQTADGGSFRVSMGGNVNIPD